MMLLNSFGVVAGQAGAAAPTPYQAWSSLPNSPVLTTAFPYQLICIGNGYNELAVCTAPMYILPVEKIVRTAVGATGKTYYYNAGIWKVDSSARTDGIVASYSSLTGPQQANSDVYSNAGLTTILLAKTTS